MSRRLTPPPDPAVPHSFVFYMVDNLLTRSKSELIDIIKDLQKKIQENKDYVNWRKRLSRGTTGENAEIYIADLLNGKPSIKEAAHDMTVRGGMRLEVKGSVVNIFRNQGSINDGRRWTWHNFLGSGGAKTYHSLILVGEADKESLTTYKDKDAPYVIFDVPFKWACAVAKEKKSARFAFHLQARRSAAKGTHSRAIWQFEVTREQLVSKYRERE